VTAQCFLDHIEIAVSFDFQQNMKNAWISGRVDQAANVVALGEFQVWVSVAKDEQPEFTGQGDG
jgi:hypothetical protein